MILFRTNSQYRKTQRWLLISPEISITSDKKSEFRTKGNIETDKIRTSASLVKRNFLRI